LNAQRNGCILDDNRDNPPVDPNDEHSGSCNTQYQNGSDNPEQYTIDVGRRSGSLTFTYETYTVKDRIHIYHGGSKVFDSGCVGTKGLKSRTLTLNGSSSVFRIIVDPKCEPQETSGTAWYFTLGCPSGIKEDPETKAYIDREAAIIEGFEIDEIHKTNCNVDIFPNPANDFLYTKVESEGEYSIHIYDIAGKRILERGFSSKEYRTPIEHVANGTYIVHIYDKFSQERIFSEKLIIIR
jgi:hypothetical protein